MTNVPVSARPHDVQQTDPTLKSMHLLFCCTVNSSQYVNRCVCGGGACVWGCRWVGACVRMWVGGCTIMCIHTLNVYEAVMECH